MKVKPIHQRVRSAILGASHAGVELRRIDIEPNGKIVLHMALPDGGNDGSTVEWRTEQREPELAA